MPDRQTGKAICNVKKEIKVPVFANGDVVDIESAKKCLQESNADGIAIGRGILGNPDLIARIMSTIWKQERCYPALIFLSALHF